MCSWVKLVGCSTLDGHSWVSQLCHRAKTFTTRDHLQNLFLHHPVLPGPQEPLTASLSPRETLLSMNKEFNTQLAGSYWCQDTTQRSFTAPQPQTTETSKNKMQVPLFLPEQVCRWSHHVHHLTCQGVTCEEKNGVLLSPQHSQIEISTISGSCTQLGCPLLSARPKILRFSWKSWELSILAWLNVELFDSFNQETGLSSLFFPL